MPITVLDLSIRAEKKQIVDSINFTIDDHSFTAIMGANGSGKTSLLYAMNGIIPHASDLTMQGMVTINSLHVKTSNIATIAQTAGTVFQDPELMLFHDTVYDEVMFGVANRKLDNAQKRVEQALEQVGLLKYAQRDPDTLSEGQKQAVCIACALALDTEYLLLDEPAAHLDYQNTMMVYTLLHELHQLGKTIVVVEHDTDLVRRFADRVVILHNGTIVEDGPPKKIFADPHRLIALGIRPVTWTHE